MLCKIKSKTACIVVTVSVITGMAMGIAACMLDRKMHLAKKMKKAFRELEEKLV